MTAVHETAAAAGWRPTASILCECNCGIEVRLGGEDGAASNGSGNHLGGGSEQPPDAA